jgi:hypothetical protein
VVRFSPPASRELEQRPELELLREREDGSTDHALYYTDAGWAASRVMRQLGEAVVEPEELRQEVYHRAGRIPAEGVQAGSMGAGERASSKSGRRIVCDHPSRCFQK